MKSEENNPAYQPGMVLEVTQQIPQRDEVWTGKVRGTVVKYEQAKTGSWYAHSRDEKFWLDRLTLRHDDGEVSTLILDRYTHVQVISEGDVAGNSLKHPEVD